MSNSPWCQKSVSVNSATPPQKRRFVVTILKLDLLRRPEVSRRRKGGYSHPMCAYTCLLCHVLEPNDPLWIVSSTNNVSHTNHLSLEIPVRQHLPPKRGDDALCFGPSCLFVGTRKGMEHSLLSRMECQGSSFSCWVNTSSPFPYPV